MEEYGTYGRNTVVFTEQENSKKDAVGGNILIHALKHATAPYAGKTGIIEGGHHLTYAGIWQQVEELSVVLRRNGVSNGTTVVLYYENGITLSLLFLAVLSCNAVPFVINGERMDSVDLNSLPAGFLLMPSGEAVPAITDSQVKEETYHRHRFSIYRRTGEAPMPLPVPGVLVMSSGSTGAPGIVFLGLPGVLANMKANIAALDIHDGDVTLLVLSMSYSYGLLAQFLSHLYAGATVVIAGTRVYLLQLPVLVKKFGITTLFTVPALLRQLRCYLLPEKGKDDFTTLRLLTIGGNFIDAVTLRMAMTLFGCPIAKTYGLAEAGPRVCTRILHQPDEDVFNVGVPLRNVSVDIAGLSGRTLMTGAPGRIRVRSTSVALACLNKTVSGMIPARELLTADYGYLNNDGDLIILGRKNGYLKLAGKRIWFAEIENLLYEEAGILKVNITRNGSRITVNILVAPQVKQDAAALRERIRMAFGISLFDRTTICFVDPAYFKFLK